MEKDERLSNYEALVQLIVEEMGSLEKIKKRVLERSGRKYVARNTIRRAFEGAAHYILHRACFPKIRGL